MFGFVAYPSIVSVLTARMRSLPPRAPAASLMTCISRDVCATDPIERHETSPKSARVNRFVILSSSLPQDGGPNRVRPTSLADPAAPGLQSEWPPQFRLRPSRDERNSAGQHQPARDQEHA